MSEVLTEKERRQAANRVDPIFKIDQLVVQEIEQGIGGYFEEISKIKNDEEMTDEEKDVLKEKLDWI